VTNTLSHWNDMGVANRVRTINAASPTCTGGCQGWRIQVGGAGHPYPGERVVTDAQFVADTLFITTWTPNGGGTCDIRGMSGAGGGYVMAINYTNGGNPDNPVLDKDMNGTVNNRDTMAGNAIAGVRFTGGILSSPIVDPVNGAIYFKTGTDLMPAKIAITPMGAFKGSRTIIYHIKH